MFLPNSTNKARSELCEEVWSTEAGRGRTSIVMPDHLSLVASKQLYTCMHTHRIHMHACITCMHAVAFHGPAHAQGNLCRSQVGIDPNTRFVVTAVLTWDTSLAGHGAHATRVALLPSLVHQRGTLPLMHLHSNPALVGPLSFDNDDGDTAVKIPTHSNTTVYAPQRHEPTDPYLRKDLSHNNQTHASQIRSRTGFNK